LAYIILVWLHDFRNLGQLFSQPNLTWSKNSISIKDFVQEKKIRNRKKERATETLNLKFNTKPLKFKCGLADGGGGGAGQPMQGMGTPT
jgi:hypothetical protein